MRHRPAAARALHGHPGSAAHANTERRRRRDMRAVNVAACARVNPAPAFRAPPVAHARAAPTIGNMKNLARVLVTSVSALLLAGCASHHKSAPPAGLMNTKCVVSGEPLDAKSPTVDYQGGKVGFCCKDCVPKWNA